jgi:hypothetical protein
MTLINPKKHPPLAITAGRDYNVDRYEGNK